MCFIWALFIFFPLPCHSFFPKLLWKSNILGTRKLGNGGFRKGNGLVLSMDQKSLWMTDAVGRLHLVRLDKGNDHVVFDPTSLLGASTESRSSVVLYESDALTFAVYAVIDVPMGEIDHVKSRIICVDANNQLLWTTHLDGSVIGNPQISSNGNLVVILHNQSTDGVVSILSVRDEGAIISQKPSNFLSPFGPSKLVTVQGHDVLYWGESTGNGYANYGKIMHMNLEQPFEIRADFLVESSTVVSPSVSVDGSMMWIGGKNASIYSWTLSENPGRRWKTQLPLSRRNSSFPIVNQIEAFNNRLFVASATNSFHCLDAEDGEILWSVSFGPSIYLTSAKYSVNGNVVYSIQHLNGKVIQHRADTGDLLWHFDCINATGIANCMDSVEAEPCLSNDGTTLYYGDIYGTVYALAVSEILLPPPTSNNPTMAPMSQIPKLPTQHPSTSPSQSLSNVPTSEISKDSMFPSFNKFMTSLSPSLNINPTNGDTQYQTHPTSNTSAPEAISSTSLKPTQTDFSGHPTTNATSPLLNSISTSVPPAPASHSTLAPPNSRGQIDEISHHTASAPSQSSNIPFSLQCVFLALLQSLFLI